MNGASIGVQCMMDMIVGKHPGIISYSDESIDHYNASQKVPTVPNHPSSGSLDSISKLPRTDGRMATCPLTGRSAFRGVRIDEGWPRRGRYRTTTQDSLQPELRTAPV